MAAFPKRQKPIGVAVSAWWPARRPATKAFTTSPAITASTAAVQLVWRASAEPDVAGYIVYRTDAAGVTARVGTTRVPDTTFTDRPVASGTYRYEVTAYDTAAVPNASAPSSPATVTVP